MGQLRTAVQPELTLDDFYADMKRLALVGHWQREQAVSNEPRADVRPWLWRWSEMRALHRRADMN